MESVIHFFFSAHMDTVEPGKGISPRIDGDYIVSDGTTILGTDNKLALACMLVLACDLVLTHSSHCPLEFVFTRSEEIGNYGALHFDYSLLRSKRGLCFDSGNPVGTIVRASPFYDRFDIIFSGQSAHASRPDQARNVLFPFADLLARFPPGKLDDYSVLNYGVVQAGSVRNTIPGELRVFGEVRSFSEDQISVYDKSLEVHVSAVSAAHSVRGDVRIDRENPGYFFPEDDVFIEELAELMHAVDITPRVIESWGVSDANIFNDRGLRCLNLGHGGEFIHTVQERVSLGEVERLYRLMRVLVSSRFV